MQLLCVCMPLNPYKNMCVPQPDDRNRREQKDGSNIFNDRLLSFRALQSCRPNEQHAFPLPFSTSSLHGDHANAKQTAAVTSSLLTTTQLADDPTVGPNSRELRVFLQGRRNHGAIRCDMEDKLNSQLGNQIPSWACQCMHALQHDKILGDLLVYLH